VAALHCPKVRQCVAVLRCLSGCCSPSDCHCAGGLRLRCLSHSGAAAGPPRPGRRGPPGRTVQTGQADRTCWTARTGRPGQCRACGPGPGPANRHLAAHALLRPPLTPTLRANRTVRRRRVTYTVNALRAATSKVAALSTKMSGGVLLSHAVPRAVPSALKSLTSGFGMGPGVSPSPWPPKLYGDVRPRTFRNGYVRADRISGTAQWTQAISIGRSQATRPISTGQLHTSPCFHLRPINPVV
jgi:hypothetical protein